MKINAIISSISVLLLLMSSSCRKDNPMPVNTNSINVVWNKAYTNESIESVEIGLEWALSSIGASNFMSNGLSVFDSKFIKINPIRLGLPKTGENVLIQLHQILKQSGEYELNDAIDIGRYITLIIGASEHYYDLVGIPVKLSELLANYSISSVGGYVNVSGVSGLDRVIQFSQQNGLNQVFISEELNADMEIVEYETIEVMENGHLRFGIFDINGNRINAADPTKTTAGKPAKCIWCHESRIQPLLNTQMDIEGYLTGLQFRDTLDYFRMNQIDKQLNLINGVNFSDAGAHEYTELLYISFMEPSAQRLSEEWNLSISEVQELLSELSTHIHPEFPFLGTLYDRNEVEIFAPFSSLKVSTSVREASEVEVNYLN